MYLCQNGERTCLLQNIISVLSSFSGGLVLLLLNLLIHLQSSIKTNWTIEVLFYCSSISSIIFFLAHSGQMMFSPSWVHNIIYHISTFTHILSIGILGRWYHFNDNTNIIWSGNKHVSSPHLNKSLADHGVLADVTEEALVVPGERLKRHKLGASETALTWWRNTIMILSMRLWSRFVIFWRTRKKWRTTVVNVTNWRPRLTFLYVLIIVTDNW